MQASRMFERFDAESRGVINRAQEIARELRHNWIGTEHLLLGLEGSSGADVLAALEVDVGGLRQGVVELVGSGPAPLGEAPAFTPRAKKALELALREALTRNDLPIAPRHVLMGLVREGEGVAYQAFGRHPGLGQHPVSHALTLLDQAEAVSYTHLTLPTKA